MDEGTLVGTRRALHGVAELILAGPQYRRGGGIKLRVVPGGFGNVAWPDFQVDGDQLVTPDGPPLPLSGATYAELAAAAGGRGEPAGRRLPERPQGGSGRADRA
jgi:hypothetical protein